MNPVTVTVTSRIVSLRVAYGTRVPGTVGYRVGGGKEVAKPTDCPT